MRQRREEAIRGCIIRPVTTAGNMERHDRTESFLSQEAKKLGNDPPPSPPSVLD